MPLARRGRLLDIGCANGNFLRAFGAQNPGWALSGLENSTLWRETVLGVPGVEGYHCDLGELDGQRFDLIVMSHVLEHIPDPVHYLAGLGALLEEGGRLCLAVPDIRQNPIDLLVLDHCTHFDAASLGRVLNRGGFPAQALQADIIRREIIAISPFDGVCSDPESAALGTVAADSLAYLTALMARARELRAGNARLGIMGTSTAAIWITGELGMAVDFYVDEDMRRIGKTLFGKPILSLQQVPAGTCVFMPMTGVVARSSSSGSGAPTSISPIWRGHESRLQEGPFMTAAELRARILDLVETFARENWPEQPFIPGTTPVPVSGKVFDGEDVRTLVDASLDFWLTTGRFAEQFEREFARFMGVRCGLAGELRLLGQPAGPHRPHLAAAGAIGPCSRATRSSPCRRASPPPSTRSCRTGWCRCSWMSSIPTYNVDVTPPGGSAVAPRTRAVMLAHTLGNPFDLDGVHGVWRRHRLWLIEDCCDALGPRYRRTPVGTFGDLATVSFYPAHHITMGEGGAVLTADPLLKKLVESFRDWGRDCWCEPGRDNTCGKRFDWQLGQLPHGYDHKYTYSRAGYNLKLTDYAGGGGPFPAAQAALVHQCAERQLRLAAGAPAAP